MYSYNKSVCSNRFEMYRSRGEIKEDIERISEEIARVNAMLNIRELISDVFSEQSCKDAVKKAEAITELLKYAEEALDELKALNETLDELKAELIMCTNAGLVYERGEM